MAIPLSITMSKQSGKPFKVTCKALNASLAELRITGDISGWENSSEEVRNKLDELVGKGVDTLRVYINSGGGSVFEANEVANLLKEVKVKKVARLGALCASAATIIAIACDEIEIVANGMFMVHRPSLIAEGNIDDLESATQLLRTVQNNILKAYAKRTGMAEEDIEEKWLNDWWMNAEEALEMKFVDKVIDEEEITNQQAKEIMVMMKVPERLWMAASNTKVIKPNNHNTKGMDRDAQIELLGLPKDATDEQIETAMKAMKAKADKVAKDEENALQREAEEVVDKAIADKKILVTNKSMYIEMYKGAPTATAKVLKDMAPVDKLSGKLNRENNGTPENRKDWDWEKYQSKDPKALLAMKDKDSEDYDPENFRRLFREKYGKELQASI